MFVASLACEQGGILLLEMYIVVQVTRERIDPKDTHKLFLRHV